MATERLRLTGGELRNIRALLGWSQERLAQHLRVSRHTVSRWECETRRMRPSNARLIRLAVRARAARAAWRRHRDREFEQMVAAITAWGKPPMVTKQQRARKVQQRIDSAIAQSKREPLRPDSDGGTADWPKRTDDRIAIPISQPKGKHDGTD